MSRIASCFARGSFLVVVLPLLFAQGCGDSVEIAEQSGDDAASDATSDSTAPSDSAPSDGTPSETTGDDTGAPSDTASGGDGTSVDTASVDTNVPDVGCVAVSTGTYYVDSTVADDTTATGAAACAFKTVTRAVQFLGTTFGGTPPMGTKILVRSKVGAGETWPIAVPTNTLIRGATSAQLVEVPAGQTGFSLATPNSALSTLVVDGKGVGHTGVKVSAGSTVISFLEAITVTGFANDGVLVEAGTLDIRAGVHLDKNGVMPAQELLGSGLHVVMNGHVAIRVPSGAPPSTFDENGRNGMLIYSGEVTVTGAPDLTGFVPPATVLVPAVTAGAGTVTARKNKRAGVSLAQLGTGPFLENVLDGVVSWNNVGAGIAVITGTKLRVRNSVVAKNTISGINVQSGSAAGTTLAQIDLGTTASPGKNILQTPSDGNVTAGLCVGNLNNPTVTLSARGNYFNGKDCVAAAPVVKPVLNTSRTTCEGGIDVGIEDSGGTQQTNITVALDNCQNF